MSKKDKTVKSVSDPACIGRRLINEPDQESSTGNGKLGVNEYEKPRKCMVYESHCGNFFRAGDEAS